MDIATQTERDLIESSSSPALDIVVPVDVAASASAPLDDEAMAARPAARQQQQKPPQRQQQPVPALDMSSESSASEDDDEEARQASGSGGSSHSVAKAPSTANLLTVGATSGGAGTLTPTPNAATASFSRGSAVRAPAASLSANVGGEAQLPRSPRAPLTPRESAQSEQPDGRKRSQTQVGAAEAGASQALSTSQQFVSDPFLNVVAPSDRHAQLAPDVYDAATSVSPRVSLNLQSPRETRKLRTSKLANASSSALPAISVDDYTSPRVRLISIIKHRNYSILHELYGIRSSSQIPIKS